MSIVLPAYNEAERIGPALDELFGYLDRRGTQARDGAPGSAELPATIDVLVVDDGSTDGTADLVARPARGDATATGAALGPRRAPRRQGRRGPGRACSRPTATSSIFADADMATPPDQLPLLVAALATHDVALGSRIQPDGSRHARDASRAYRRMLGKAVPPARLDVGRRPGQGHPVRLQGLHPRRRAGPVRAASRSRSIVFDVELIYLARRRGYDDRDRADPLGATGAARGCAPGPGLALRVAWDLFRIPLIHRRVARRVESASLAEPPASR